MRSVAPTQATAVRQLAAAGKRFYDRGWVMGTSGNFSAVTSRTPVALTITASSAHKGKLGVRDFLEIGADGKPRGRGTGKPSAEALLHTEIVRRRGAGAVLHTHSHSSTILSDVHAAKSGFAVDGYEMLKGLEGVRSHEHREWIPIVENDQDIARLAKVVGDVLDARPDAHAFLIRRHGLYTWGRTIDEAERHIEILEFLFETIVRQALFGGGEI